MRNTISRLGLLAALLVGMTANAQQDPQFTQYFFNPLAINSGYAGTHDVLNVTLLAREQWVGVEGRPRTQTLAIHSPLRNEAIGIGLSIVNDQLGPVKNTAIMADMAYRLKVNHKSKLAFGMKAGANLYSANLIDLVGTDVNDISFAQNISTTPLPNFGFSLYWWSDRAFAGLSTPRLIENEYSDGATTTMMGTEKRHFFLTGGYVFDLHPVVKFKPTAQVKYVAGSPVIFDVTANLLYDEKFWVGGFYRLNDAAGVLLSYQVSDQLRAGYSYDYTLSALNTFSSGSHEIMLSYDFKFSKDATLSPRYF